MARGYTHHPRILAHESRSGSCELPWNGAPNELPISCGRGAARDHVTKATILRTEGGQLHGRVGRAGGPIASHCHTPRHVPCGAIGRATRHPEQLPRHARQHPRHVPCVRTGRTTRHAPGLPRHVRRARTDRPGMRDHAPSSGRGLRRPTNEACSVMANRAACDDHLPTPERPTGCPSAAPPLIVQEHARADTGFQKS